MRATILRCADDRKAFQVADAIRLQAPSAAVTHNGREVYTDASPQLVKLILFWSFT